jgi:hypothetical protein
MDRRDFLRNSTYAGAGLLVTPYLPSIVVKEEGWGHFIYEVVATISEELLGKTVYGLCLAELKNPQMCELLKVLTTKIAGGLAKGIENIVVDGVEYGIKWVAEKLQFLNQTKLTLNTKTLDDALDASALLAHPDCHNWTYVSGLGKFPLASRIKLSEQYIAGLSADERCIMRNELFARHKYKFNHTPEVIKYFNEQTWYRNLKGTITDGNLIVASFSETEKYNLNMLVRYRNPNDCHYLD